ncbi:MAG TPA: ATP-binding protein, partial [Polyangia bacterium]
LLRARLYRIMGRFENAMQILIEAIRRFGFDLPESTDAIARALRAAEQETERLLAGRPLSELMHAPQVHDPTAITLQALITEGLASAFPTNSPYLGLLARAGVNAAIRDGNSAESCYSYSVQAMLLANAGHPASALAFSELALALSETFSPSPHRGVVRLVHVASVGFRTRPFSVGRPLVEEAFTICFSAGDFGHANAAAVYLVWLTIEEGRSLAELRATTERFAKFASQMKSDIVLLPYQRMLSFVDCLYGLTGHQSLFPGSDADDRRPARLLEEARFLGASAHDHLLNQIVTVVFGNFTEALATAEAAKPYLPAVAGTTIEASFHFYYALALAGVAGGSGDRNRRKDLLSALDRELELLADKADECPANYLDRHLLVSAERARLDGRDLEAMQLYDRAIAEAEKQGFTLIQSLACELCAGFYRSRGFERSARAYLEEARAGYQRWGATGKVAQLEARDPDLQGRAATPAPPRSAAADLDVPEVIKAAQAISREMLPSDLIERLMVIVLDLSGASRGLLLSPNADGFTVEAEAVTEKDSVAVMVKRTAPTPAVVPESVVRYVLRTRRDVAIDDATTSPLFAADPYLIEQQPRSLLCLPLLHQGEVAALIYLENRLARGAFPAERMALLRTVAAQAAISLQNARLFSALEEERSRLTAIIEQVPTGLMIVEAPDGRVLKINRALDRILRQSLQSAASLDESLPIEAYTSEGRRYTAQDWPSARSIRRGEVVNNETAEVVRPDGSRAWVTMSSVPVRNAAGEISAGVVTLDDVTERRNAEAALRASEERFSKAFHNNPTPMAVVRRRDAVVVDANQNLLALLDASAAALVGRSLAEPWASLLPLIEDVRNGAVDRVKDKEVVVQTGSGEERDLLISIETVALANEPCLLMTFVDLTERKRVEEQLRQSQKMEAIGSLAGGVAHDFNNLLTVINGYAALLLARQDPDAPDHEALQAIKQAGERASNLTRKLLAFSRKPKVQAQHLDLNQVVAEMQTMLRRLIEADIAFHTQLSLEAPLVRAERGEIEQVLMNLVVNARDAMAAGGDLTVTTETAQMPRDAQNDLLLEPPPGAYVVLAVSDTGVGMSAAVRSRIFEPFFTTKEEGKGTGLGLSVVYAIVKRLKGGIAVSSQPGEGTTFQIFMPALSPDTPASTPKRHDRVTLPGGNERILVVEDDVAVRGYVVQTLRGLGYQVTEAGQGHEALATRARAPSAFDLVMTDLMMPEAGGSQLARALRTRIPGIPILFMSGSARAEQLLAKLGENPDHFLRKPFTPAEVARKLRTALTP